MLLALAELGGAAHGEVLDGAAEAGHFVALEVGEHHHGRRPGDLRGDAHGMEVLAVDDHGHVVLAVEAVGDDDGAVDHARGEAVAHRRFEVVHGVMAGARVEGGGVGQEGLGAGLADFVHHDAHELGVKVGVVAHLAEVQLHGAGLALDHAVLEAHQGQQARHFGLLGLVVAATGHGVEVDGGSHVVSLACRWHWGVPWSAPRPGVGLCPLGKVCQIRGKSKYFPSFP